MKQKQKIALIIAIASFLLTTTTFAASWGEGKNDSSGMKKEQDGSVSKEEFMKHHQWMFEQNDTNKNGYLDTNEMKNLHDMVKNMHNRFEQKH